MTFDEPKVNDTDFQSICNKVSIRTQHEFYSLWMKTKIFVVFNYDIKSK